ncbi:MAG TPA: hypothetical protein PKD05_07845 [Candidatus Melainabacteria bacterium]|nr:hypothetical protein [Candidatus Melainabacteria bacterium]HMP51454.1 hypothetical protein [Candidatus Melainabacteria bacterium]
MIKRVIKSLKNSKLYKAAFGKNYETVKLVETNGCEHPWQQDLDHLAEKLGHEKVQVSQNQETRIAESTVVEQDFQKLFNQVKQDMEQQKQSGSKKPVVTRKRREADITAVDLQSWWGQSVATWDPIDSKNVDSVSQQPRRQRTKWFDSH